MNITGSFAARHGVNYTIVGWSSGAFSETSSNDGGTTAARDDSNPEKLLSHFSFNASRNWTGEKRED